MNIFFDQFSTGQVTAATGVTNATLQSWLKRDIVTTARPEGAEQGFYITGGGAPGAHRRYSFRTVMEIAIAKALIDAGMENLENAFKAAVHFAHFGSVSGSYGLKPAPTATPNRIPGLPHGSASGKTLIAARGDRSTEYFWERRDVELIHNIMFELGDAEGFVLVNASAVFNRVVKALDYDPYAVMTLAYGWKTPHENQ